MTPGARGFLWGAILAGAGMLALPDTIRLAVYDGPQSGRRHVAEFVVVDTDRSGVLAWAIDAEGQIVPRTHIAPGAFGLGVDRYETRENLPRHFSVRVRDVHREMAAEGRICPIVILSTPDGIRISPCLVRR